MPEVNLSTLRDRELRQLLDSARQRGQASLSYMILQEMDARRTHGGREKPARRPAEPRIVAVDLSDPLERTDDLASPDEWAPAPQAQAEPHDEPGRPLAEEPPLRLDRAQTAGRPPPPPPKARMRSRSGWGALLFACGLALGLAGGWKAAEYAYGPRLAKAMAPEPAAASPQAAAPATAPEPAAAVPEPPPPPPAVEPAPQIAEVAPETPAPNADPAPPPPEAEDQPQAPAADEGRSGQPEAIRCSAEPTPADQAICRSPRLQRLQRELRRAYAAALEAHEDRALLRQRQLAWADARDAVGDPERLARIYEDRIRRLDAATAEALRER